MRFKEIDFVSLRRTAQVAARSEAFVLRTAGEGLASTLDVCEMAAEMPAGVLGMAALEAEAKATLQRSWEYLLDVAGQPTRPLPLRSDSMGASHGRHLH